MTEKLRRSNKKIRVMMPLNDFNAFNNSNKPKSVINDRASSLSNASN